MMITEHRKNVFFRHVSKSDNCWLWIGARMRRSGYGSFGVESLGRGNALRSQLAHRVSWQIFFGEIPNGLCVLHECDNPPCVNPFHLRLGTHLENMEDAAKKGRKSSKLTPAQVKAIRHLIGTKPQHEIAKMCGVRQSTVSNIATGKWWGKCHAS